MESLYAQSHHLPFCMKWSTFVSRSVWGQKRKEQTNSLEEDNNDDDEDNDSNEDQSSSSSTSDDIDKTVENIPDVLYQQKIKKRKDKRETTGKWTLEGMKRSKGTFFYPKGNKKTRLIAAALRSS